MTVTFSSALLSLPPLSSDNSTPLNSESSDLTTPSSNSAISPNGSRAIKTEPSQVPPKRLVHTQSVSTSPPPDVLAIVTSSSESLTQSHPLKSSTVLQASWLTNDSLSSTARREPSPTKLVKRSTSISKLSREKPLTHGPTLTSPLDLLVMPTEKYQVSSVISDITHSQPPLVTLMEIPPIATIPSTFNLPLLLVLISLFSLQSH